jgi:DNA-binding transcriptional LysR family regulator
MRYFVAVAEELHFGRAADRLHMSQSPLSRAIRDLERELGSVLFVRTTRRVELTAAGSALLASARRALAAFDGAVADARRFAQPDLGELRVGYGPLMRGLMEPLAAELEARNSELRVRFDEVLSQESLGGVAAHELVAAVVIATPAASTRHRVRIDALRDEPLLAALPESHAYAGAGSIPVGVFAGECVLLPREEVALVFNPWFRAAVRAVGFELERTMETLGAPWDRRMLPVASGEAVSVIVAEWARPPVAGIVGVPFDPPLSFPIDLASRLPPTDESDLIVEAACRVRDARGWLTVRPARTDFLSD